MAEKFSRASKKMAVRGMVLSKPGDLLSEGEYQLLCNTRAYVLGTVQQRPGLTVLNATALADLIVHSIRRLNNSLPSATAPYARVVGAGTSLYVGTDYTLAPERIAVASGFDGNPLSLVPVRPPASPEPWMYVANKNRSGKVNTARLFHNHGIAPPLTAPGVTFAPISFNNIVNFDTAVGLTNGGTAGGLATALRVDPGAISISKIIYDAGSTGWAVIAPNTQTSAIQPLMRLTVGSGLGNSEKQHVQEVYKAITSTTIAAIQYNGVFTTGPCTIVFTSTPKEGVVPNALLRLNSGGANDEVVRVLEVLLGTDGLTTAIRVSTINTHAAGETISGLTAFRIHLDNTHVAAEPLEATGIETTITTGIGTISKVISIDLSVLGFRPAGADDFLHLSVKLDSIQNLTEGKLMLDCDAVTNDFTQNYFYAPFRPNDFQPAANDSLTQLTAKRLRIGRRLTDVTNTIAEVSAKKQNERRRARLVELQARADALQARLNGLGASPGPDTQGSSDQALTGASQWTEFIFRLKDLQRVGSDTARGLRDIKAVRIQFSVTASTVVDVDELYFAGGYGPEVGRIGTPYTYISRFRSSKTGAKSNWSPPYRNGILPHRQAVTIAPAAATDAQVDKIDIARFGGTLSEWIIVATIPATATPTFEDGYTDDALTDFDLAEFRDFQPFPVSDIPRTGTCRVVGNRIARLTGDLFNTFWGRGNQIIINGTPCTLYTQPTSVGELEIVENMGSLASTTWLIKEPTILGVPLPAMWGPYSGDNNEVGLRLLACGAPYEPGTLFVTNGNDPDSADEKLRFEITSPSEPLMNGCVYDGRAWVFSSERLFHVQLGVGLDALGGLKLVCTPQEVPNSKGLFARFALTVTPKGIVFVSGDGIYVTNGGEPVSLTDADLYPLFPHDGQAGITINGIAAPDFTLPNAMTLEYNDGLLFYDFTDTAGARRTLVLNMMVGGWQSLDSYTPGAVCHYSEEGQGLHSLLIGGADGRLYSAGGVQDAGAAITSEVLTGAFDAGDSRAQKLFGDLMVDADTHGMAVAAAIGLDNNSIVLPAQTVNQTPRGQQILDLNSGVGREARNICVDFTWTQNVVTLFEWAPSYLVRPEVTDLRVTDFDDLGNPGVKWFEGVRIWADTGNTVRTVKVQSDAGVNGAVQDELTLTAVQHNGQSWRDYSFAAPFRAHSVRLLPTDAADSWKLYGYEWIWEQDSPLVTDWVSQPMTNDQSGFWHVRDAYIAHISTANLTLTLICDGVTYTYTIAHGAGTYQKTYLPLQAIKFKSMQWKVTSSAGFRLYKRDIEIRAKSWGAQSYQRLRPFGELSATSDGPRI